jgi:hypothetical protein
LHHSPNSLPTDIRPAPRIGFAPAKGAGLFCFGRPKALSVAREIAARAQGSAIIIAEQGYWWTSMIRPLAALPVVIYIWKVVVYDKILGLGTTDAITGDVGTWAGVIITTYSGGRTIEKVARIFRRSTPGSDRG